MKKQQDNEQYENLIKELLNGVKEAKDFVGEQAPLVCKELIAYEKLMCFVNMIVVTGIGLGVNIFMNYMVNINPDSGQTSDLRYVMMLLSGIISSAIVLFNLDSYIKLKMAPRVFLLEHIKYLLKGDNN